MPTEKALFLTRVRALALARGSPRYGATALISLGTGRRIPARWAMTGELTLTGRVLPVGGIKEKVIAAKRARVKNVILPKDNEKDFDEIQDRVRKGITPHYVEAFKEVHALLFPPKKKRS